MATTSPAIPLQFWACGSDVLMRVPGSAPVHLTDDQSRDLLDLFEAERRAAERAADGAAWALVMTKARQLTAARIQASRWAKASDIPRAA